MPFASRYVEFDEGPAPAGYANEETAAAEEISTPGLIPLPATRSSAYNIFRYYSPEQIRVEHRRKLPKQLPLAAFHLAPDPIRQSDFLDRDAYNNLSAWSYYPDFPDTGWESDTFTYSGNTSRGRDIKPADKTATRRTARGLFENWTGLRRNIVRDYPETYGTITSQEENPQVYNTLEDRGGY